MSDAARRPREHSARIRGARLAWREWGEPEEPAVLALHGWLDNAASFDALAPLLQGYRVIAPDLPGSGQSDHRGPEGSYNIWDDLPDLVALTRELGLAHYRLLGHSRGAAIATLLSAVEATGEALACVEEALKADPSDTQLAADLKETTARHALKQGGYDRQDSSQVGGFRANIKDASKLQELQDAASIVQSEETEARILERARKAYEENPMAPDAIQKLGTLLKKQATPDSEEEAHAVFMAGFERTNEYRFKAAAGEIRVMQLRRKVAAAAKVVEANAEDEAAKSSHAELRSQLLDFI